MELEPMLSPREESPLPEKFSSEEDRTYDAASSRTVSSTHYQQAIPALCFGDIHHAGKENMLTHALPVALELHQFYFVG